MYIKDLKNFLYLRMHTNFSLNLKEYECRLTLMMSILDFKYLIISWDFVWMLKIKFKQKRKLIKNN